MSRGVGRTAVIACARPSTITSASACRLASPERGPATATAAPTSTWRASVRGLSGPVGRLTGSAPVRSSPASQNIGRRSTPLCLRKIVGLIASMAISVSSRNDIGPSNGASARARNSPPLRNSMCSVSTSAGGSTAHKWQISWRTNKARPATSRSVSRWGRKISGSKTNSSRRAKPGREAARSTSASRLRTHAKKSGPSPIVSPTRTCAPVLSPPRILS